MNGLRSPKPVIVAFLALIGSGPALGQQSTEVAPGLYSQTIQSETYLQHDGQTVDVPAGEAGFADRRELERLDIIPSFLAHDRTPAPGLAGQLRACGIFPGSTPPLSDQPLQSDLSRYDQAMVEELDGFLADGYPAPSVLMHAAGNGMSIDRALYAAVRSQPQRAGELYTTALELMGYLPGWTCGAAPDTHLYDPVYNINDLPDPRRVAEVASRYFESRARLAPFPDWPHGEYHMLASAAELLALVAQPQTDFWYRPGPAQATPGGQPRETVLIGLYPGTNRIVVDTTAARIRQWRDQGQTRIPVTFVYNLAPQRPISSFPDEVSLEAVMEAFFRDGEELTPVPLWAVGDYHLEVSGAELTAQFELPDREAIEPARYQALRDDLAAHGFSRKPVLATLMNSGGYRRLAEPDRVRVALDQGIERFPVTLFYQRLDRQACGAPALCFEQLCDALVCAGGDPNVCLDPAAAGRIRGSNFQAPAGGSGGSAPPPTDSSPPSPPAASPS